MPSFNGNVSVPAGGRVANIIAGSAYEYLGRPSRVAVALVGAGLLAGAVGDELQAIGDVTARVQYGPEVHLENGSVMAEGTRGQGVDDRINTIVDELGAAGDRVVIELANSSGAAVAVRFKVKITPLA